MTKNVAFCDDCDDFGIPWMVQLVFDSDSDGFGWISIRPGWILDRSFKLRCSLVCRFPLRKVCSTKAGFSASDNPLAVIQQTSTKYLFWGKCHFGITCDLPPTARRSAARVELGSTWQGYFLSMEPNAATITLIIRGIYS